MKEIFFISALRESERLPHSGDDGGIIFVMAIMGLFVISMSVAMIDAIFWWILRAVFGVNPLFRWKLYRPIYSISGVFIGLSFLVWLIMPMFFSKAEASILRFELWVLLSLWCGVGMACDFAKSDFEDNRR